MCWNVKEDTYLHVKHVCCGPAGHEFLRLVQGLAVVQETHPEGGKRADHVPGAAVRAPHLQETLEANLWEDRRQVILPILHHCKQNHEEEAMEISIKSKSIFPLKREKEGGRSLERERERASERDLRRPREE